MACSNTVIMIDISYYFLLLLSSEVKGQGPILKNNFKASNDPNILYLKLHLPYNYYVDVLTTRTDNVSIRLGNIVDNLSTWWNRCVIVSHQRNGLLEQKQKNNQYLQPYCNNSYFEKTVHVKQRPTIKIRGNNCEK